MSVRPSPQGDILPPSPTEGSRFIPIRKYEDDQRKADQLPSLIRRAVLSVPGLSSTRLKASPYFRLLLSEEFSTIFAQDTIEQICVNGKAAHKGASLLIAGRKGDVLDCSGVCLLFSE